MNSLIKATHKHWREEIESGEKTYELGKGFQNVEVPFKDYIYEPKNGGGCGMVVGEFICDEKIKIMKYSNGKPIYALHITAPKFYDKPKELGEFKRFCFDGIYRPKKCEKCQYDHPYWDNVNEEMIYDCDCGLYKPIERAPQNFIYCEDLEETK